MSAVCAVPAARIALERPASDLGQAAYRPGRGPAAEDGLGHVGAAPDLGHVRRAKHARAQPDADRGGRLDARQPSRPVRTSERVQISMPV